MIVKGDFGEEKGWWFGCWPAALRALTLALSRRAGEGTHCWLRGCCGGLGDGCCGRGGSRTAPTGWAKGEGVGAAVNFGHPPARCARVPLRVAKGGIN